MTEATLVPAIDRAIALLSLFKDGQADWSLAELHQRLDLPKSTVHAILTTLVYHGYLERDPATRRYRLGAALLELAHYVPSQPHLPDLARPHLQRLRNALDETAVLGVYVDGHATLLEIAESRQMIKISAPVGKRLPMDAGCFGKLYLASRAYTARTLANPQQLRAELAQVRAQGYATDDQEYIEDVWAVAAPVFQNRRLACAVAVIGIARRMDQAARSRAAEGVCVAAHMFAQWR
jgi:DNA-binding IclR family transcriptional regulator